MAKKKTERVGKNQGRLNVCMDKELLFKWKDFCRQKDLSSSIELRKAIKERLAND